MNALSHVCCRGPQSTERPSATKMYTALKVAAFVDLSFFVCAAAAIAALYACGVMSTKVAIETGAMLTALFVIDVCHYTIDFSKLKKRNLEEGNNSAASTQRKKQFSAEATPLSEQTGTVAETGPVQSLKSVQSRERNPNKRNILLLGKSRVGKSALIDFLSMERTMDPEKTSIFADTKMPGLTKLKYTTPQQEKVTLHVLDCPGFYEQLAGSNQTARSDRAIADLIANTIKTHFNSLDAIDDVFIVANFDSGIDATCLICLELMERRFLAEGAKFKEKLGMIITRSEGKRADRRQKIKEEILMIRELSPYHDFLKNKIFFSGLVNYSSDRITDQTNYSSWSPERRKKLDQIKGWHERDQYLRNIVQEQHELFTYLYPQHQQDDKPGRTSLKFVGGKTIQAAEHWFADWA